MNNTGNTTPPQLLEGEVEDGWVKIEDGLPDVRYDVYLVFNGNDPGYSQHIRIASWFEESKQFKAGSDYEVTHYKPLPSSPKQ